MSELKLPDIGFGTWQLKGEDCRKGVLYAIDIGYRHIDTAQVYKNEEFVGQALSENTISRKELVIATKVFINNFKYKKVKSSTYESLKKLKLDYVDMLYIHWPAISYRLRAKSTLKAMSELVDEGKVKHICVSNFNPKSVEKAIKLCDKPITANQIECHPLLQQKELREYLSLKKMYLVAYSPLIRGNLGRVEVIKELAEKYKVSMAQVSLAWHISKNVVPIPKATSKEHIKDNYKSINLKLDISDIEKIDNIKMEKRMLNPPKFIMHPGW
jgi:2,5-diketo-D-gluconate reductase B